MKPLKNLELDLSIASFLAAAIGGIFQSKMIFPCCPYHLRLGLLFLLRKNGSSLEEILAAAVQVEENFESLEQIIEKVEKEALRGISPKSPTIH